MHLNQRNAKLFSLLFATLVAVTPGAKALDGTWTQITSGTASGTWIDSTPGNWAGGVVAGGSGATANFATLDLSGTSTVTLGAPRTIGNIIFGDTGTGALVSNWVLTGSGANTLTLDGATPTITVNTLGAGSLSLATISASISGTSGLTKNGNGTTATSANAATGVLVLSGSNNYSGGTTISAGALRAQNNSALGTGAVTVANGAQLQLTGGVTIANTININGANALFSTTSAGVPTLSGLVNLQSNSGINLATNSGNATMVLSGTVNLAGFILSANTINADPAPAITIGAVTGTSGISKAGAGTLLMNADNSLTYSGTTTVTAGTLALGSDGALGTGKLALNPGAALNTTIRSSSTAARTIATSVTLGGGSSSSVYRFGSTTGTSNGALTFTNTTSIVISSGTRLFEVANRTQFDAGFTGASGITMQTNGLTGTGTLALNGINTYTGTTAVTAGTLLIGGSLSSSSVVTVTGTGAVAAVLGGSGTIGGNTTLGTNSFLTPGTDGTVGNLKFSSGLNISGITPDTGALKFDLATTIASDKITLTTGVLTIGSGLLEWNDFSFTALSGFGVGTYTLFSDAQAISGTLGLNVTGTIGGLSSNIAISGNDLILNVVPEPATYGLMVAGLIALLVFRRRGRVEG